MLSRTGFLGKSVAVLALPSLKSFGERRCGPSYVAKHLPSIQAGSVMWPCVKEGSSLMGKQV